MLGQLLEVQEFFDSDKRHHENAIVLDFGRPAMRRFRAYSECLHRDMHETTKCESNAICVLAVGEIESVEAIQIK